MRVLVLAYACEPSGGGEPEVGWRWAQSISRQGHEVTVITRSNNRDSIEGALRLPGHGDVRYEYVDLPAPVRRLKRRLGQVGVLGYSWMWQFSAAARAWRLRSQEKFDVYHHVTFCNDSLFSGLALAVPGDAQFLWGPVGGASHQWPNEFERPGDRRALWFERTRSFMQSALSRVDPFLWRTRSRADLILPYTVEAVEGLPERYRQKSVPTYHIGIDASAVASSPSHSGPSTEANSLLVATGGRLVAWKGFDVVIEAIARARSLGVPVRLVVFGSGPFRAYLDSLVTRLDVGSFVDFLGRVPAHEDVLDTVRNADLFAQPTLRDGPPVALLEAMSVGTAVLCYRQGASGELVSEDCGFLIDRTDREDAVTQIVHVLQEIAGDRELIRIAAQNALERVRDSWTWDALDERVAHIYGRIESVSVEK